MHIEFEKVAAHGADISFVIIEIVRVKFSSIKLSETVRSWSSSLLPPSCYRYIIMK